MSHYLRKRFDAERVSHVRPLDATVRGAAAVAAGVDPCSCIRHGYSIRSVNPENGEYEFVRIVSPGDSYPSDGPIASFRLKATHKRQRQFAVVVYEDPPHSALGPGPRASLSFDSDGAIRLEDPERCASEKELRIFAREHQPFVLEASQPSDLGEERFEVSLSIDSSKRLIMEARDLRSGRISVGGASITRLV